MDGNRTSRRLLAADRTVAGAIKRVAAMRAINAAAADREHARVSRAVDREMAAAWGRDLHIRMPVSKQKTGQAGKARRPGRLASISQRALKAYKEPLRDARGRIALYFRIRYVGLKSKTWRPGLAADHILYILREEALENGDIERHVTPISNMGETTEEIHACWRALETVEEGYRANAQVQYRIIWNLPHALTADERRTLVEQFCERRFGRLGLPYVAAIHKPDERGDQRNFHAHVCFSTRPCEHTGDRQWAIAQEKVNGLTDKARLKLMRALVAGHMNLACRKAGLDVRFTHQTYADRDIDAVRQEHVGPARMALHDAGETVAVVERNAKIVMANEAAAARDAADRDLAHRERLSALMERSLSVLAKRQQVSAELASVMTIAARARAIVTGLSNRPQPSATAAQVAAIHATTAAIATALSRRRSATVATSTAMAISSGAASISRRIAIAARQRAGIAAHRSVLTAIEKQIEERRDQFVGARPVMADRSPSLTIERAQSSVPPSQTDPKMIESRASTCPSGPDRRDDRLPLDIGEDSTETPAKTAKAGAPTTTSVPLSHSNANLEWLLQAIEEDRHAVIGTPGRRRVSSDLLKTYGIDQAVIGKPDTQRRLEAIAAKQALDLGPIVDHVRRHPEQLRFVRDHYVLDDRAPAHLRDLVDLWAKDDVVHAFFERQANKTAAKVDEAARRRDHELARSKTPRSAAPEQSPAETAARIAAAIARASAPDRSG